MDIVRFSGGLGNQMFQYAFMLGLIAKGRKVVPSLGYYKKFPNGNPYVLENVFPRIKLETIDEAVFETEYNKYVRKNKYFIYRIIEKIFPKNKHYWLEQVEGCYDAGVYDARNCVYIGYWQSELYFQNVKEKLKINFQFEFGEKKLQEIISLLKREDYTSIHVRRGDYLDNESVFGGICTINYYEKSIKYILDEDSSAKFMVFSNDIAWVKDNIDLPEKTMYIENSLFENYRDWYDMCLMATCKNNIIANSSFSWWGAWLNSNPDKIVIAPSRWLNASSTKDIWVEGWIKI